ncbi:hypothetical protein [Cupriavidus sp. PET2-C1]
MLLCRQLGLAPLAGLMAGSGMATSPLFMYWLTFPVFSAVATWSAATLYGMTRLSKSKDLGGWAILCFSVYSLLMTAYPQPVVVHTYMFVAYGLVLVTRQWREAGRMAALRYIGLLVAACVVAGALCVPVYLDLYRITLESTRLTADPLFFVEYLPHIESFADLARFLTLALYPEVLGNPIASNFALPYDGLSMTPPAIFFAICALLIAFRRCWGWWVAIALTGLFTFSPTAYLFGVKYLGFNLSPSAPLGNALLPMTIVVAYGLDSLYDATRAPRSWKAATILASMVALAGLAGSLAFALHSGLAINWMAGCMALAAILILGAQVARRSLLLPSAALAVTVAYSSYPLMLHQDPASISISSPLASAVRAHLPPDSRYAVLSPGLKVLPPNLNATLGLDSIHSYNSLSSYRYRNLLNALGSDTRAFGRWNDVIQPDFNSIAFWMSNIAVVLSPAELPSAAALQQVERLGTAYVYRVISRMGCCVQVRTSQSAADRNNIDIPDAALRMGNAVTKTSDMGDIKEFDIPDRAPSLLVLSQKFHQDWHAQALTSRGWEPVPTVAIDGVFQGAVLPDDVRQVRLRFEPYARFAWIAHAFWLVVLVAIAAQFAMRRASRKGAFETRGSAA